MNETNFGKIIHGEKQGRTIGFPTANLDTVAEKISIEYGIYAGYVTIENKGEQLPTAIIVRPRNNIKTIEIHILDFDENIYDANVIVTIKDSIREWKLITDIEVLKKQIVEDLFRTRMLLNI
jgi:riboflavin kinase/FMN adenylyltransferase